MNFRTENLCEPAIAPQTLAFSVLNYILVDTGNSSFRLPESKYENNVTEVIPSESLEYESPFVL